MERVKALYTGRKFMILVFLLYALFGLTFTFGKMILFYASPFFVVASRMLLGGAGLMGYLYFFKHIQCRPQKKDWPYYLQVALFGIFVPYCLRAWALQDMSSTKAAFIFTLMPFFTALFAYLFLKERLSFQKSMGLMVGFLGMTPTFFTTSALEEQAGAIAFFSFPELAMLGSVASFAYNLIALQTLVKHRGCPAVLANGMSMLIGGFLSFNAALLLEPVWIKGDPWYFLSFLVALLLISNFMGLNLQASLLKHHSATFMAFAGFLTPLFTAFFGWLLLGEAIKLAYLLSFVLVVVGLVMFHYDEIMKHKDISRAEVPDASEF